MKKNIFSETEELSQSAVVGSLKQWINAVRQADKASSRYLWCQRHSLDTYLPRQPLSNALSFPLSWSVSQLPTYLPFFLQMCLQATQILHICLISSLSSSQISYNQHFTLCFVSLQPAEAAGKQGQKWCVCVSSVSSVSSSSPSSNKLSLEWAGKSPCGLVPSNCNPQHIITMAGSPLHYCSRAEAGRQHVRVCAHTHIHTHSLSFHLLPFPEFC